jgi:hypothetical protein
MKSIRTTLALITFVAAGSAQAQEAMPMPLHSSMSTLDRAAVLAEARRALATDQLAWGNEASPSFGDTKSQRDRAAVREEAAAANKLSSAELARNRLDYGM